MSVCCMIGKLCDRLKKKIGKGPGCHHPGLALFSLLKFRSFNLASSYFL